jgi:hypothetical protein
MPKSYTLDEVKNFFADKKCIILSDSYVNQLQKLDYIASCGHNHKVSVKEFLLGKGVKCRVCALEIPTYESICKKFSEKNCEVIMTSDEFNEKYKNNTCKINYIASCSHTNSVSYKNFISLNQGINCPNCVFKNNSCKLKKMYSNGNNLFSLNQEFKVIQYFRNLIDKHFIVIKSFDGCKADIIIKTIEEIEDLWLGIQVKTTIKKTDKEQYYFRLNDGKYDNCLILCVCDEDKKMWLIPYEEVKGLKTIGIAKKSKYNKYEINTDNLIEKLNYYYKLSSKTNFDILDTPTSKTQQQEQSYRKMREEKIKFVEFKNNTIEGLVYDFMIGNKKVQEKVGSIVHNNNNSFVFCLVKYKCRVEGKCKKQCYEEGDNDLYWLNCKNGFFYVIPEKELISRGFIGENGKEKLYVSPTNKNTEWCNDYLFNYEEINKDKLLEIII